MFNVLSRIKRFKRSLQSGKSCFLRRDLVDSAANGVLAEEVEETRKVLRVDNRSRASRGEYVVWGRPRSSVFSGECPHAQTNQHWLSSCFFNVNPRRQESEKAPPASCGLLTTRH